MLIIGNKYKVNQNKLDYHTKKYHWEVGIDCGNIVTAKERKGSYIFADGIEFIFYSVEESDYWFPEDCLCDFRKEKLNRII
jgi:hypothetical protein